MASLVFPGAALALVLTASQAYWANEAYKAGLPYGEGYTLAAISGQESSYCRFKVNGWSRGCLGIKRSTARSIGEDPAVTRKQLTEDNHRNILVGLQIFLYCSHHTQSWRQALLCYHYGEPAEKLMVSHQTPYDPDDYIGAITKRLRQLQQIPVTND